MSTNARLHCMLLGASAADEWPSSGERRGGSQSSVTPNKCMYSMTHSLRLLVDHEQKVLICTSYCVSVVAFVLCPDIIHSTYPPFKQIMFTTPVDQMQWMSVDVVKYHMLLLFFLFFKCILFHLFYWSVVFSQVIKSSARQTHEFLHTSNGMVRSLVWWERFSAR